MRIVDIITTKRDGGELSREEIEFFIKGYVAGDVPDYQAAAFCMALFFRGMTPEETTHLTEAMAFSGETLDLHDVAPFIVDKHSSGGVGDKTTLVVGPMVASLGVPVGKMSGRGLSFSGGTLDKLESIPGFNVNLTIEQFKRQLRDVGVVVAGQTHELAPADGKLYALRDVTATVNSLPLIASSIMSKKIAAGADAIVLDVKVGHGAFMETLPEAVELAKLMAEIGRGLGRKMTALLGDMSQPLGLAAGNALEVVEAVDALHGRGPADFRQHCVDVAGEMLLIAGAYPDPETARSAAAATLDNGAAWAKFREWIAAQGGDLRVVDDPSRLAHARRSSSRSSHPVPAMWRRLTPARSGSPSWTWAAAGRRRAMPWTRPWGSCWRSEARSAVTSRPASRCSGFTPAHRRHWTTALARLANAYSFSEEPVAAPPVIHRIIR